MPSIKRFLVIDDEPICNLIAKHLILQISPEAEISVFTQPEDALAFIQGEVPKGEEAPETVLLLDINMPFISGWEFLEEFQTLSLAAQIPYHVYIVSSSIDDNDRKQADHHPLVKGFLSKPLSIDSLSAVVKLLGSHSYI